MWYADVNTKMNNLFTATNIWIIQYHGYW